MNEAEKRERTLGWALAATIVVHLVLLRPLPAVVLATLAVLLAGAVLRGGQAYIPLWLGRISLLIGIAAVIMAQGSFRSVSVIGELAAVTAALLLLRPVTAGRGLWVLFCLLLMLTVAILKPYTTIGRTLIILDVAALLILAEQIHRPPEALVSFWVSIMRSLRVIVPVGIVVTGIFWFFPNLSVYAPPVMAGFSGSDVLDPGNIAQLAQSRRVAMTARFSPGDPIPPAGALYWRGQVLELNDGMRWLRAPKRLTRETLLRPDAPPPGAGIIHYAQDLTSNRGGIVPVLDHAIFVEAKRSGEDVAVPDIGPGVLTAVGAGPLTMQVASSLELMADTPLSTVAQGCTEVPKDIRESPGLQEIVQATLAPASGTEEKLRALSHYFLAGNFSYSLRPGRIRDVSFFLERQRRGFCEHYAAAAANLLRMGGVPARVITGYRGGRWNPWLRTITIQDADAHAWVEAWDPGAGRWLRFDPTDYVAPDFAARIEREMNSAEWPWYRLSLSYVAALVTESADWAENLWTQITTSEAWDQANVVLFCLLVAVALFWLVRNLRNRRAARPEEAVSRWLSGLERDAALFHRERKPGETPLAWLARLEDSSPADAEKQALHELADLYDISVYQPAATPAALDTLRMKGRELSRLWRTEHRPKAPAFRLF